MNQVVTKVFKNGNSQAVRIPAEFRLDTDCVRIFKNEQGDLVIHPIYSQRGTALLEALSGFDQDFIEHLESEQSQHLPMQDREDL